MTREQVKEISDAIVGLIKKIAEDPVGRDSLIETIPALTSALITLDATY